MLLPTLVKSLLQAQFLVCCTDQVHRYVCESGGGGEGRRGRGVLSVKGEKNIVFLAIKDHITV